MLKVGEEQLKKWEKKRGYYSALAVIETIMPACAMDDRAMAMQQCRMLGSRHLNAEVRWMTVTCLKNGVDRYWRPGAPK